MFGVIFQVIELLTLVLAVALLGLTIRRTAARNSQLVGYAGIVNGIVQAAYFAIQSLLVADNWSLFAFMGGLLYLLCGLLLAWGMRSRLVYVPLVVAICLMIQGHRLQIASATVIYSGIPWYPLLMQMGVLSCLVAANETAYWKRADSSFRKQAPAARSE